MTPPSVAVLDYGAGNLHSAAKALERAGARAVVAAVPGEAAGAQALLVPGVGHFGQCVRRFRAAGFEELVRDWAAAARPLLGICVGLQILFDGSEESPAEPGLGLLPGRVRRLRGAVRVPHMGWNSVRARRDDPLLDGVAGEQCYFVHSYHVEPAEEAHVVATTDYGSAFACVVRAGALAGTQFHPEKSSTVGLRLLTNFVRQLAPVDAPVDAPLDAPA